MKSVEKNPTKSSYDQVPYESLSFTESHPDRLSCVGRLFGMKTPDATKCRVLEIGCARGENLIPMAYSLPNSDFVGIDNSDSQIDYGKEIVKELGLSNIKLTKQDILGIEKDFGTFDYIVAHGVFSWVDHDIQERIFKICSENLSENGVAYVSYNTYPGWSMRKTIRDMMLYHCKQFSEPAQFISQARALLNFIANSTKNRKDDPYTLTLNRELERISKEADWYLFHDYLEEVNDPIYFHEFAERGMRHGLQFLGEAQLSTMIMDKFPAEIVETLKKIAPNIIQAEQFSDFLMNQAFRRTLLCHKGITLNRTIHFRQVCDYFVASQLRPNTSTVSFDSNAPAEFYDSSGRTFRIMDNLSKAAFLVLSEIWPSWMPFDELLELSSKRVGKVYSLKSAEVDQVARTLLRFCIQGLVELHTVPPKFSRKVENLPTASALVRLQAKRYRKVVNMRHETIEIDPQSAQFLPMLDGKRDLKALEGAVLNSFSDLSSVNLANVHAKEGSSGVLKSVLENFAGAALLIS